MLLASLLVMSLATDPTGRGATSRTTPAPVAELAPAPPPPPPPPPPEPLPVAPLIQAEAAPTPSPPPQRTSFGPRWLPIAATLLGGAGVVTAIGLGIGSMTSAGERYRLCPGDLQCSRLQAYEAYDRAVTAQTAGWVALGVGAGLLMLGAVLFFVLEEGS